MDDADLARSARHIPGREAGLSAAEHQIGLCNRPAGRLLSCLSILSALGGFPSVLTMDQLIGF
jgi:hypothetical protein